MGDIGSIKHLSLFTSTIGVYLLLQIQIYDIVLQSGWWFGPLINKAYSLLQEVCINCFKSEYMYASVLQNGLVTLGHLSITASTRGVYYLLQIQIHVSA